MHYQSIAPIVLNTQSIPLDKGQLFVEINFSNVVEDKDHNDSLDTTESLVK
jgi:hypothetical protein